MRATIGAESGGAGAPLLEVGAGAEHGRGVGEHDGPHGTVGDPGLGAVEGGGAARRRAAPTGRCGWRGSRA